MLVDTDFKKMIIKIALVIAFIAGIIALVMPFFNTGIILKVDPKDSGVEIDNKKYEPPYNIKISSGKHSFVVFKSGYKKIKGTINVKRYGKTRASIELKDKSDPIPQELPETNTSEPYNIKGDYNKYSEPTYTITLFDSTDKEAPKKWLRDHGVDVENTELIFIEDGG